MILGSTSLLYPSLELLLSQVHPEKKSVYTAPSAGLGLALITQQQKILQRKNIIFHLNKTKLATLHALAWHPHKTTYFYSMTETVMSVSFTRQPLIYPALGLAPTHSMAEI